MVELVATEIVGVSLECGGRCASTIETTHSGLCRSTYTLFHAALLKRGNTINTDYRHIFFGCFNPFNGSGITW